MRTYKTLLITIKRNIIAWSSKIFIQIMNIYVKSKAKKKLKSTLQKNLYKILNYFKKSVDIILKKRIFNRPI